MAKKLISDRERFLKSIIVTPNGCWEWQLVKCKDGYGWFKVGSHKDGTRRQVRAHRWAYEEFTAPIPYGLKIDHLCRNRSCVNPKHLEPVTGLVNTQRGWRANKTECKSGHPLSGDNLYVNRTGVRSCKECKKRWKQEYLDRNGGVEFRRQYERQWRARRRQSA